LRLQALKISLTYRRSRREPSGCAKKEKGGFIGYPAPADLPMAESGREQQTGTDLEERNPLTETPMQHRPDTSHTRHWLTIRMISAGSLAEGIVGAASGAVAIIGLFGIYPEALLAFATIGAGTALLLEGGAVAGMMSVWMHEAGEGRIESAELGGGMVVEFLGGCTGVVLGVLSLLGVRPSILLPAAVIVLGITLLLASGVTARMNTAGIRSLAQNDYVREAGRQSVHAAAGAQLLIGMGALALGIIALDGVSPITLSLAAMLGLGVSDLLNGTAMATRITRIFRKTG
jgi:hypothetical protein